MDPVAQPRYHSAMRINRNGTTVIAAAPHDTRLFNRWRFYLDAGGKWRWSARSCENGEVVGASTQGYSRFDDCESNARRLGFSGDIEKVPSA